MAVWAALIVFAVAPGFAMLLLGREKGAGFALVMALLGITLPLIGHATWHAYRATIDASAWPRNERHRHLSHPVGGPPRGRCRP